MIDIKEESRKIDDLEISGLEENVVLLTSSKELTAQRLNKVMSQYVENPQINQRTLNSQSMMKTTLTEEKLESLAWRAQENIEQIKEINSYVDYYLNKDDIIGKTYEIIEANTNAEYNLSYPKVDGRNKKSTLDKVRKTINEFNKSIGLDSLIVDVIPHTYSTGNRVLYLRKTKNGYLVDKYPLGVAQITSFSASNEPIVMFSISDLINRMTGGLSMTIDADSTLYKDMEEAVKASFPPEVYAGYVKGKNSYVKLDSNLSGVIRVNNRDKRYGLTPIFKALNPALKLEIQEKADSMDSKARGKKIIFQEISDKILGDDGATVDLGPTVHAHDEFLKAWKNEVVVYTGAPWVKNVSYVEPKNSTDHFNSLNYYRSKVLSALGIAFLNSDSKTGVVTAEINLAELMRTINRISEQLEDTLNKWYKVVLKDNGLPVEYAPSIKIIDSELMEMNLKMQMVDTLFSKLGASYDTSYKMLGVDYQSEIDKRKRENAENIDEEVFYPRMTNFTMSGKDDGGVDNTDVTKTNKTNTQKVDDQKKVEEKNE